MSRFHVVPLGEKHDRAAFSCGKEPLDNYLKRTAKQDVRRHIARAYVMVPNDAPTVIAGFYTLSQFSIDPGTLPKELERKYPKLPLPCTLIGRLAVARPYQRQGLGEALLGDALERSYDAGQEIAAVGVVVDALDDEAEGFYRHCEFIPLPATSAETGKTRLTMMMNTIEKQLQAAAGAE